MLDEDDIVTGNGFENEAEMCRRVSAVDISTPEKLQAFKKWQEQDGTKAGLLALGPG